MFTIHYHPGNRRWVIETRRWATSGTTLFQAVGRLLCCIARSYRTRA